MLCPGCNTDRARRSHRRGVKEHLLGLFGRFPYRCRQCQLRFYVARSRAADKGGAKSGPPNPTEREIQVTRAGHARKQKRREMLLYGWALLLFLVFLYYVTRDRSNSSDGG